MVDTPNTYLYLVLGNGQALRYGIGVGRDGFTWAGTKTVEKKAEWPDWHPPQEMLERQPYLPRFMAGGPDNPLGARAMYLSGSVYRIHGTNAPHDHRPARVVGLLPPHERGRDRPLQPREGRRQGRGPADERQPDLEPVTVSAPIDFPDFRSFRLLATCVWRRLPPRPAPIFSNPHHLSLKAIAATRTEPDLHGTTAGFASYDPSISIL